MANSHPADGGPHRQLGRTYLQLRELHKGRVTVSAEPRDSHRDMGRERPDTTNNLTGLASIVSSVVIMRRQNHSTSKA